MKILLVLAVAVVVAVSGFPSCTNLGPSQLLCQVFLGGTHFCPATSCAQIAQTRVWDAKDGYYWLTTDNDVSQVYCAHSITPREPRGWMRVGLIDAKTSCPSDLEYLVAGDRKVCRKTVDAGCSSVTFKSNGISYSKVCGRVYGYADRTVDGFKIHGVCRGLKKCTIDQPYMDGVSITHGRPRQHVWTLAASTFSSLGQCPCSDNPKLTAPRPYVGGDYYCDIEKSGTFLDEDRLWDGKSCSVGGEACCKRANWFCKDLPQPTNEDIEFRLCADQVRRDEDVYIEFAEIYVQ